MHKVTSCTAHFKQRTWHGKFNNEWQCSADVQFADSEHRRQFRTSISSEVDDGANAVRQKQASMEWQDWMRSLEIGLTLTSFLHASCQRTRWSGPMWNDEWQMSLNPCSQTGSPLPTWAHCHDSCTLTKKHAQISVLIKSMTALYPAWNVRERTTAQWKATHWTGRFSPKQ